MQRRRGASRGGGMMTQLEPEMETLLMETPRAAPPLPRNQQRRWEEQWRLGVEQQQRRRVDESIPASAPAMGGEGVCRYDDIIPGYSGLDDWNALDGEQQEDLSLRAQLIRSTGIWKGKGVVGAAATGNINNPIDPYGIWSRQKAPMSSPPGGTCSVPINLLGNGGVWSDLKHHQISGLGRSPYDRVKPVVDGAEAIEEFVAPQKNSFNFDEYWNVEALPISPPMVLHKSPAGFSALAQQKGLSTKGYNLQYPTAVGTPGGIDNFSWEDSFISQGKEFRRVASNNVCEVHREGKGMVMGHGLCSSRVVPLVTADHLQCTWLNCLPSVPPEYESLMDIQGFVSLFAKDRKGCQFLQHKFEMGTEQERKIIFNEIIDHVPELMVNRFGNNLMKKVLDICTEEQRLEIVLVLTKVPNELVWISLNMHGAKAVQKLIEVLQSKKETALIISALKPGFLNLVMDQNGNHVIQRCLQYFDYEQKKFIFEAAVRYCVNIATHWHGCCVLQRCIDHSTAQHRAKLLAEVSRNGLSLAQHAYG